MAKLLDIEQVLRTYMGSNGFTIGNIYLEEFPANSTRDSVYLIRRVGSGDLPRNLNIDVALVRIWARHTNPATAYANQKAVADLLQGLANVTMGTSRLLYAELQSGPEREDDVELDVPQWAASYLLRITVP